MLNGGQTLPRARPCFTLTRIAALAPACMAFASMAQVVERPVFHEGDTWTYRHASGPTTGRPGGTFYSTQTKTITRMLDGEFELATEMVSEKGEKTTGVELSSLNFNDFAQPPAPAARVEIMAWMWPVEPGKTWRYDVPVRTGTETWEAAVLGWEDVEVPAGKFRTLKVERNLLGALQGSYGRRVTVWYSPDAKVNVRVKYDAMYRTYTITNAMRELISYRLR